MNQSKSENSKGNQKTKEKPCLLQISRDLLSNGQAIDFKNEFTDLQIQQRKEALNAVESMTQKPLTAEELKYKIEKLKENAEKMNQ